MNSMSKVQLLAVLLGGWAVLGTPATFAQQPVSATAVKAMPAVNNSDVQVPIYKSRVLSTRAPVNRISVGNPAIADILITSPTQLYLLGRSLGSTNVLLWDNRNQLIDSLDVEVVHDLGGLKAKLHQVLPNERIEVFSAQGALALRGQVSSAAAMDSAVKLAQSYAAQASAAEKQRRSDAEQAAGGDQPARDRWQPAGHAGGEGRRDAAQPVQESGCALQRAGFRLVVTLVGGRLQ